MSEIHCRFTGEIKYPPELKHSEKSGRTWCRLQVMVAAGSLGDVGVVCFGGRARRVCETLRAGDMVAVEGRLSFWAREDQSTVLSVISTSVEQATGNTPNDVGGHRARHTDAETTSGWRDD